MTTILFVSCRTCLGQAAGGNHGWLGYLERGGCRCVATRLKWRTLVSSHLRVWYVRSSRKTEVGLSIVRRFAQHVDRHRLPTNVRSHRTYYIVQRSAKQQTMLSRSTLLARRVNLTRTALMIVPTTTTTTTTMSHRVAALSTEATSSEMATAVTLNFSVPYDAIYHGAEVAQVILPGVEGEYGVTPGHVPYVAQLKPGVVQIMHEDAGSADAAEKYFVAGGYAFTHANSVTVSVSVLFNITCCLLLLDNSSLLVVC